MYQALYRKWRPRTFSDVYGQEHVTETLRRQITGERLSHAYLFVGTRGTGKTTCAKLLSRAVNCESPENGNPCNKCPSCLGIENGSILDVLELDAASNNGVDNVRALREEAIYTPAAVKKRVYIIDETHMLSPAAFNALLKILEEPPEHLMFILATTELHKVPATILSRCQRFSFRRLSPEVISARLAQVAQSEGLELTAEAAEKLAALADGSMRDALSLLDQCAAEKLIDLDRVLDTIGLAGRSELLLMVGALAESDTVAALAVLRELYDDGRDMASLLGELAALIRDVLVCKLSKESPLLTGAFTVNELLPLAEKLSAERLLYCLDIIREALQNFSRGGGACLVTEMCIIKMCDERLSDSGTAILSRLAELESRLDSGAAAVNKPESREIPESQKTAVPQETPVVPQIAERESQQSQIPLLKKEQEHQKTPEQQKEEDSSERDDEDYWQKILEKLKKDIPVYTLLSDNSKVTAELHGAALILRAGNPFTASSIESKSVSEPLREAASKVLGREVTIKVETGTLAVKTDNREKLERLSAFDIIKFE